MAATVMKVFLYALKPCASLLQVKTSVCRSYLGTGLKRKDYNRVMQLIYPCLNYSSDTGGYKMDGTLDVPVDRMTVTYSRSSGPGGQHVNKVNTKAEVRFHVLTADWIPEEVRNKILLQHKNRINKAGQLVVSSEATRSQQRNLDDCLKKIRDIIAEASEKPPEPTAEDVALRTLRLERRNKERLKEKKMQSALKQSRKVHFD